MLVSVQPELKYHLEPPQFREELRQLLTGDALCLLGVGEDLGQPVAAIRLW